MERFFAKDWNGGLLCFLARIILPSSPFSFSLTFPSSGCARSRTNDSVSVFGWAWQSLYCYLRVAWQTWSIAVGKWNIRENLPLHMCSLFLFINSIMVLTRSKTLYELSYCLGIGSGLQAFLTPDPGPYGLWHFVAVQTIFGHGLLVTLTIYMTIVEGFRPSGVPSQRLTYSGCLLCSSLTW